MDRETTIEKETAISVPLVSTIDMELWIYCILIYGVYLHLDQKTNED